MFYSYEVGQKILPQSGEGIVFDMTDSGGILLIKIRHPTAAEKKAFKSGLSIRFAIVDKIIFLLVRMCAMQWMDAPYYRWLSKNLTAITFPEEGQGLAVHVMLIDAETGILVAQKLISLEYKPSRYLMAAVISQPIIPDYDTRLSKIFYQYSTYDLLKEAEKLC